MFNFVALNEKKCECKFRISTKPVYHMNGDYFINVLTAHALNIWVKIKKCPV